MQSLYLTLLTVTFALFGLFSAILFFYANQLVTKYAIKASSFLQTNVLTRLFILLGIIGIILASLGAFSLSTTHNLIPRYDFHIRSLVTNPWYAVAVLFCVFILCGLFVYIMYRYPKYLNANILVPELFKRIGPADFKKYVFYFYKVPEPTEREFLPPELRHLLFRQRLIKEKLTEEQQKEYEKRIVNFQSALKEFNDFKKEVSELSKEGKINDPFSTVVDMSTKSLNNHDFITWGLIHDEVVKIIETWLKDKQLGEFESQKSIRSQSWDPYFYLSKLLVQRLSFIKEVVIKSGHPSLLHHVVSTSKHLTNSFAIYGHNWNSVLEIASFMKKLGKELIETDRLDALHPIFETFGELGEQSIRQKEQESFEEICRSIGWLGEHLIMRGIPIEPLTPNYDATGVIESIENCLQKIKGMLIKERFCVLSQIYYEAIEKITQKLIDKGREEQTFENALVTITRCIAECGEEAAKIGDSRVVSDSIYWLKNIYYYTERVTWFKELPQDIFDWMAETGALCACHNKPIEDPREASILFFKPTTAKQDLIEVVIQEMGSINDEQRMKNAMHNIYGKYPDYHEAVWEFITRMGKVCKSNFGFNFDWDTGERYAPDDPRREKINRF